MKTPTIKKCSKCGEVKILDEFSKDAKSKDGKQRRCKSCRKEYYAQQKAILQRGDYKVITEKKCSKCGEVKPADEFHKNLNSKDGKDSQCKSCRKEYYAQQKAILQRDGYKVITEKKCSKCGEVKPADEFSNYTHSKDGKQSWCKSCVKEYYAQPHVKARTNERDRERYKNDPQYKIARILRDALRRVLKGGAKTESALVLVGCTTEQLWEHLENSFVDGMTVQNHGEVWHVGHIECLSGFDGTNEEHIKRVNHFSNLKAQFKEENLSDGAHVPDNHQAGLPLWYD
jgi:ribosomal protein L32